MSFDTALRAVLADTRDMNNPIVRAEYLLHAVVRFLHANPLAKEGTVVYDDAVCDGVCLANDCKAAAEDLARLEQR